VFLLAHFAIVLVAIDEPADSFQMAGDLAFVPATAGGAINPPISTTMKRVSLTIQRNMRRLPDRRRI